MNRRLLDDIKETMGLILEVDPGEISEETRRGDSGAWDSLAHLNLILALEENYGIEFLPEEIEQVVTVRDVTEIVQRKLDEQ